MAPLGVLRSFRAEKNGKMVKFNHSTLLQREVTIFYPFTVLPLRGRMRHFYNFTVVRREVCAFYNFTVLPPRGRTK